MLLWKVNLNFMYLRMHQILRVRVDSFFYRWKKIPEISGGIFLSWFRKKLSLKSVLLRVVYLNQRNFMLFWPCHSEFTKKWRQEILLPSFRCAMDGQNSTKFSDSASTDFRDNYFPKSVDFTISFEFWLSLTKKNTIKKLFLSKQGRK